MLDSFNRFLAYLKAVFIESQRWVFTFFDILGIALFLFPHLAQNLVRDASPARGIGAATFLLSFLLANFSLYTRTEEARDRQLGRSCSLSILHVRKLGHRMEVLDNPWDPFELRAIEIDFSFSNTSERPIFLKALHTYLRVKNDGFRILGRNILREEIFGAGVGLPFRYMDYTQSSYSIGLSFPRLTLFRIPYDKDKPRFARRLISTEHFIDLNKGVTLIDEDNKEPVSRKDWVELPPGDRKVWSIHVPIKAEGAFLVRKRNWEWSTAEVLLEFDTYSFKARSVIPYNYYFWTDSQSTLFWNTE